MRCLSHKAEANGHLRRRFIGKLSLRVFEAMLADAAR
jgi:hypothetical protein